MPITPKVIESWLEFRILDATARGSIGGSDLARLVERETSRFFEVSCTAIYQTCERVENAGCVRADSHEIDTFYSITAAGRQRLDAEWKKRRAALAQFVEEGNGPAFLSQGPRPDSRN